MPNIHFYGFTMDGYNSIKPEVDDALKQIGLHEDAVTTFHSHSIVESCDGDRVLMPYLHIFSSEESHIQAIIDSFAKNNLFFDIESSAGDFIEAKDMKKM